MDKTIICELCGIEIPNKSINHSYCTHCKSIMDSTIACVRQNIETTNRIRLCYYCCKKLKKTERKVCKECRFILHKELRRKYVQRVFYKKQRLKYDITYKKSKHGKLNNLNNNRLRRARLHNVRHTYTQQEWNRKVAETKGICPMCNKNVGVEKLTLDHIIPISKVANDYEYTINDVQPLCNRCNASKKDRKGELK